MAPERGERGKRKRGGEPMVRRFARRLIGSYLSHYSREEKRREKGELARAGPSAGERKGRGGGGSALYGFPSERGSPPPPSKKKKGELIEWGKFNLHRKLGERRERKRGRSSLTREKRGKEKGEVVKLGDRTR